MSQKARRAKIAILSADELASEYLKGGWERLTSLGVDKSTMLEFILDTSKIANEIFSAHPKSPVGR